MSELVSQRLKRALSTETTRLKLCSSAKLKTEYQQRGLPVLQVPREGQIRDLLRYHEQDFMVACVHEAMRPRPPVPPTPAKDRLSLAGPRHL